MDAAATEPVRAGRRRSEASPPARPPHAEEALAGRFRAYRATRDRAERNALVEAHLHLAEAAARRFAGRGVPLEDLRQVALLGLVKAVERYDPAFGATFATFAAPTLLGELRRHFRDATWAVHVPRGAQELHLRLSSVREGLHHALGRSPLPAELAEAMGTTVDEVIHGVEAGNAYRAAPIDAGPGDDTEERPVLASEDDGLARADTRVMLEPALRQLPPREQLILRLRFFEQRTQSEIGSIVGLSQVQVSRVLRASLAQLRRQLAGAR